jgi:Multiubiquitin
MAADKHEVRIHIDQKPHQSPTPTTGVGLYELSHISEALVLYREVEGDREDMLIRIDEAEIQLREDEHFHSGKAPENYYTIVVNTDPVVVDHDVLTFAELVRIAYPVLPSGLDPEFTVSFEHAKSIPHEGDLAEGGIVTVRKRGTIFDVDHTNRS